MDEIYQYMYAEKTAYILFPREVMSKKQAQRFHTDDMSLPRSG